MIRFLSSSGKKAKFLPEIGCWVPQFSILFILIAVLVIAVAVGATVVAVAAVVVE